MKLVGSYPLRLVCRLLGLPRSSFYYRPQPVPDAEAMFKTALLDLAGQWPTYGYRRLTAMMRRLGWAVNSKRVRRWLPAIATSYHVYLREEHHHQSAQFSIRKPGTLSKSPRLRVTTVKATSSATCARFSVTRS